jgi:hypothetical protein
MLTGTAMAKKIWLHASLKEMPVFILTLALAQVTKNRNLLHRKVVSQSFSLGLHK